MSTLKCAAIDLQELETETEKDFIKRRIQGNLFDFCSFLVHSKNKRRQNESKRKNCLSPPPLFFIGFSLMQLAVFLKYGLQNIPKTSFLFTPPTGRRSDGRRDLIAVISPFIHNGWMQLLTSLAVQIGLGFPAEFVNVGSREIFWFTWLIGIIVRTFSSRLPYHRIPVLGSSGGNYALLVTMFLNICADFRDFECGLLRLICVLIVPALDISLAMLHPPQDQVHEYAAQVAGLLVGTLFFILIRRKKETTNGWDIINDAKRVLYIIFYTIMAIFLLGIIILAKTARYD